MKVIQRVCFGRMFGKTVFKIVFFCQLMLVFFSTTLFGWLRIVFCGNRGDLKCSSSQLTGHFSQLKFGMEN